MHDDEHVAAPHVDADVAPATPMTAACAATAGSSCATGQQEASPAIGQVLHQRRSCGCVPASIARHPDAAKRAHDDHDDDDVESVILPRKKRLDNAAMMADSDPAPVICDVFDYSLSSNGRKWQYASASTSSSQHRK